MFQHLKERADRLARDSDRLRAERNVHARHALGILRRRVGSPLGLTICFGAGVFAGAHSRRAERDRERTGNGESRQRPVQERRKEGTAHRLLHGPAGAAAIKLATAYIAGRMIQDE